jgi:peptide/nickel transport system permease protein
MSIGGVVVVEAVFAWPGLGRLFVEAMNRYDLPLISATLFCTTSIVLILNIVFDVIYVWLDPRVDLSRV